jgi:ubiquinone/menaquinone biosynthesis C-methylase UbiE
LLRKPLLRKFPQRNLTLNQNQNLSQNSREDRVDRKSNQNFNTKSTTSWSSVSSWYDEYLKDENNYQHKVILPNLLRLLNIQNNDIKLLDVGCGQGFFMEKILLHHDVQIHGIDLSSGLLKIAEEKFVDNKKVILKQTSASNMSHIKDNTFDRIYSVLALQNMDDLDKVMSEIQRVIKKDGRCVFVINHPTFRVPKESDWYFNRILNKQGRITYTYMSDKKYVIDMNPGLKAMGQRTEETVSFHHPLQFYSKVFSKHGFAISKIEEWISHKKSEEGLKKRVEDDARKEIPLFMCFELIVVAK